MFLSDISIKQPVFTTMVIVALVVFGAMAYPKMGLDQLPNVDFPMATIITIYPGADPETVETEVSKKIEEAVSTISGIDVLKSYSAENVSQVLVQFELDVDSAQAIQDVRDKVNRIIGELPGDIESPQIERFELGAMPVMTLAVSGPGTHAEITEFARKRVKENLQQIQGVGSIDIIGGQEREIKVWVDPQKLEAKNLTVLDVVNALAAKNIEIPGGRLSADNSEFAVKVNGRMPDVQSFADITIMEMMGQKIRVGDVARIEDGMEEQRSSARLNGVKAVSLNVIKQSGANAVATVDEVKARLEELKADFPPGWSVSIPADTSIATKASVDDVQFDLWFGAFLAVVIILLFLRNGRSTIISALALPTSVFGTYAFIQALGFTLNTMTLMALSLSIGILIDDAIVVIENIYRHMENGKTAMQAAKDATAEIGMAVLAITLSIVAVFVPVAFTEGMIGKFFYEFGVTVAIAVLLSMFVSLTLTPMLASRFLGHGGDNAFYRMIERGLVALETWYKGVLTSALRHRWTVVAGAIAIFVGSIYLMGQLGVEAFPAEDKGEVNVEIEMPVGTALPKTEEITGSIAKQIREEYGDIVVTTLSSVAYDPRESQHKGKVYVKMLDKTERSLPQKDFIAELRGKFNNIPDATVTIVAADITRDSAGFSASPIQFNLRGEDMALLEETANTMLEEMAKIPGIVDAKLTYEGSKPEVRVDVDDDKASRLNITTAQIGQTVRAMVGGVTATTYKEKGEDYDVVVRLENWERKDAQQVANLKVRNNSNQLVNVGSTASIYPDEGPSQIERESRQRQITIMANIEGDLPLASAVDKIEAIAAKVVPKSVSTKFTGDAEIMEDSFANLIVSLILAILLIYMILASQFGSFVHPFTIMLSLPLSLIGAVGALLLTGNTMNLMVMIGIIMLIGLVTKNAILLVDFIITSRNRDGLERTKAIITAGTLRLRPILMTTAAMIFGMLPAAMSNGHGSEMRSPMAITVIGGLITSTILTLVVVPVVYELMDDLSHNRVVQWIQNSILTSNKKPAATDATVAKIAE
jgi:HAE1 family hydrophobic/amphiphilic exporter-1